MSKSKPDFSAQQALLDADEELQEAASAYEIDATCETIGRLRDAARAFAEAWNACSGAKR